MPDNSSRVEINFNSRTATTKDDIKEVISIYQGNIVDEQPFRLRVEFPNQEALKDFNRDMESIMKTNTQFGIRKRKSGINRLNPF